MRTELDDVVIKISRTKLLLVIVGSVCFVAGGIWMWNAGEFFLKLIAVLSIAFFGLCGFVALIKLFDNKPGLAINDHELFINTSALSSIVIKQEDIMGFQALEINHNKFLLVFINNKELYIESEKVSSVDRLLMRVSDKMYGTPIGISNIALRCSFTELHEIFCQRF